MDLLRLRAALLMCRMSANSTFLVTKEKPGYSSKLERLAELFDDFAGEDGRKVVLFSEWTTMLDLIEPLLSKQRHGTSCDSTAACRRKIGSRSCTSSRPTTAMSVFS